MAIIGISGKLQSGKNTVASIIQYLTEIDTNGDNTTFDDFKEYLYFDAPTWQQKSFAHKVKEIVSILTGIPIKDLENQDIKNSYLPDCWNKYEVHLISNLSRGFDSSKVFTSMDEAKEYSNQTLTYAKSGSTVLTVRLKVRQLLQQVGTNLFRNQLHKDTWINALFANYDNDGLLHDMHDWIITDVRFENELQAIKDRGGIVIRVNRDDYIFDNDEKRIIPSKSYTNISTIEHPSETSLDNATFDYTIDNNGTIDELISKVKEILIKEQII